MIKKKSLREFYALESPIPFYTLLILFIADNLLMTINFNDSILKYVNRIRLTVNAVLLVLCVLYIAFILLLWRITIVTSIVALLLITVTGLGWNLIGNSHESYSTIIAFLLAFLAYQRDYLKILKIYLYCHIGSLVCGIVGLIVGFTQNAYKLDSDSLGLSLGLVYPNHVGRVVFIVIVIVWYLWGQKKQLMSAIVFCFMAILMWYWIKCKTAALLFIAFPILWWLTTLCIRKKEADDKTMGDAALKNSFENESLFGNPAEELLDKESFDVNEFPVKSFNSRKLEDKAVGFLKAILRWSIIIMPFLCFFLTYILGKFRYFFMEHWHYGQGIYSLLMRFISAGIMFRAYGFPLLGLDPENRNAIMEVNDGKFYVAVIIDNAYITYLLAIGAIALFICMFWLSFGNLRAYKNKDMALLLINIFMCGYGLLETVSFQFEYNFLFLYPLTSLALQIMTNQQKGLDNPEL